MSLHDLTLPGVVGDIHFEITVLTGWDRLREVFTPRGAFLDYLARRIAKEVKNIPPEKRITFTYGGGGSYEVVRVKGADVMGKWVAHSAYAQPWRGG